jgi:hypothetical protein
MGLIVSILVLGLMASLSPVTIVVFILVLGTARASLNAAAFLVGWGISLVVVFTLSYAIGASRSTQHGGGRTVVVVLEVALGCYLIALGVRRWRHREDVVDPMDSKAVRVLDRRMHDLGPLGAAVVGVIKQPWVITATAAVLVVHHHASRYLSLVAFACFMVASTASIGLMYLYYARDPGKAATYLNQVRDRAIAAGPAVFAGVSTALGVFLIIDALKGR